MNKKVARVTTRLQGDEDGLFIGTLLADGFIKPNSVYEIEKCFLTGDLILRYKGVSHIGDGLCGYTWAFEQQTLLKRLGGLFFLTKDEILELKECKDD